MRKAVVLVALMTGVVVIACASTRSFVKDPDRLTHVRTIAVLPFASSDTSTGTTIAEALTAEMIASRFTVLERSQLERLLAEQNLSIEGLVTGGQDFVGKLRGVDALILGSATVSRGFAGLAFGGVIDYVSNCSARMVDVATGEVLLAANFKADSASTWSGVTTAAEVAERIANKIAKELKRE